MTHGREAGFTLVETLVAIVVLVFGLMAVTNLLLVAASSNTVANQGSAAASIASEQLETLKAVSFQDVGVNVGSVVSDVSNCNPGGASPCFTDTDIQGVGRIHTRWSVASVPATAEELFITVRSEGTGGLAVARSRAEFTTFRACTDPTSGCP